MKIGKPFEAKGFANVSFKGFIGSNYETYNFILVDLPQMNPYDWIVLLNIVSKYPIKYEPIFQILRRKIWDYIQEVLKMDAEVGKLLNQRPILKPIP